MDGAISLGLPKSWIERVKPIGSAVRPFIGGPTFQELGGRLEEVTGPLYEPQTPYGQTAHNAGRTAAEMLGGGKSSRR